MALGWRGQYYKYKEFSLNLLAIYKQRTDIQAFLEIVLSTITLIVFIVFAIKPTALTMIGLNKEIKTKQETLNGLNKKIGDLQVANGVFIQNQQIIPDIEMSVPDKPQPEEISGQVTGLAAKNSVKILGISIGQVVISGHINSPANSTTISNKDLDLKPLPKGSKAMPISINVTGDYSNLVLFLLDLEKLRIPVKIDTISLSSSLGEANGGINELINGRVPYLGKQ